MQPDHIREYCLVKKGVTESFPFDKDTLVFKVMGKMFALMPLERWEQGEGSINLKCDPDYALELRAEYPQSIYGGYHMNKAHWNTVAVFSGEVPASLVFELIDLSYELVVKGLPGRLRDQLSNA